MLKAFSMIVGEAFPSLKNGEKGSAPNAREAVLC